MTKDWSSHLPILIKLMSLTNGDVLEIGTGIYSTPFLHWSCFLQDRKLVSVENFEEYIEFAKQFEWENHKVEKEIPLSGNWDIVFIDSFPIEERISIAKKFVNTAKYVIFHDSDREDFQGIFKYHLDYRKVYPNTSVLSNTIDLINLNI